MRKILCLTSHDLDGPDSGPVLRARNVFKLLSRLGEVRLVLGAFYESWNDNLGARCGGFELLRAIRFERTRNISPLDRLQHELNPRFMNTDWFQARTEDRLWLEKTIAEHDLVWVHGLHLANGFGLWHWPHSVLDIDDIPSGYCRSQLAQSNSLARKFGLWRQIFLWQRHEQTLWERFGAVAVCSEMDRAVLNQPGRTFVVPNGFTPPEKAVERRPANPPRIGFVGNLAYAPNRNGVRWFVDRVWPLIRQKYPTACLRIAGARSEEEKWPVGAGVEGLGWVPDVGAEMANWSLAVVPILAGGGTRVKIAEAFSQCCPVVATPLGAYGYETRDGEELLLADEPENFAEKCGRILADATLGARLAAKAWEKFEANWTWEAQAGRVEAAVKSVLPISPVAPTLERAI